MHTCTPAIWTPLRRRKTNQNCVVSLPYKIDTLITRRRQTRSRQNNQSKGDVSLSRVSHVAEEYERAIRAGITLKTITTLVPNNHAVRMQQDSEIINRRGGAWETNQISISLGNMLMNEGQNGSTPYRVFGRRRIGHLRPSPQRTTGGTRESHNDAS